MQKLFRSLLFQATKVHSKIRKPYRADYKFLLEPDRRRFALL